MTDQQKPVIPELDPGIGFDWVGQCSCGLIAGSSPAMTTEVMSAFSPRRAQTFPSARSNAATA